MRKLNTNDKRTTDKNLPDFIAKENKHLFPKDMQFAFDYVQSNPIVFPERHFRAQKRHLKRKVNNLFQKEGALAVIKQIVKYSKI